MIALTVSAVVSAVEGTLAGADPQASITGPVEHDSRMVVPGALFVAIVGERVDGHDYAAGAVAAGAVAVLGTRPVEGVPMILVADPVEALGKLANLVLSRLPELTVIGLTGSSGKTTTKDLLCQLLARFAPTVAPQGSLNNELGVPYTALRAGQDTRFLILEMGSRGAGHLKYLCDITRPRIGMVLNVGTAHIGEFGSADGIAAAKSELPAALPADGLAVLNADDPMVRAMASVTRAKVVLAGQAGDADVRAVDVEVDERGCAGFTLVFAGRSAPVRLAVAGRHQVGNAVQAAAVALESGYPIDRVAEALTGLRLASGRRMDVFERPDRITVIDDSYNANPASMAAALRSLSDIGAGRRTFAVLGYMAELGAHERQGHIDVGVLAATLGVDRVVAVGEAAWPIGHGATSIVEWEGTSVLVSDQQAALAVLREQLRPGDVVLVKGSRYRTWTVVDALRAQDWTVQA